MARLRSIETRFHELIETKLNCRVVCSRKYESLVLTYIYVELFFGWFGLIMYVVSLSFQLGKADEL
jgi:hypothetical protein